MAEEKKQEKRENPLKGLNGLEYGGLAARFSQNEEEKPYVVGALDMFAKDYLKNDIVRTFMDSAYSSPEATENAVKIAASKYQEKISMATGNDFKDWYTKQLTGLEEKEKSEIEKVLTSQGDKTLQQIHKEMAKADYILKNPEEDKVSDEEKEKATKAKEKYQNFLVIQQILEGYKMEEIRNSAVEKARERDLKGLASKLK